MRVARERDGAWGGPPSSPPAFLTAARAARDDVAALLSPRSHDQAAAFATLNRLDTTDFTQLRTEDPSVAAVVMACGSLESARNPSAAITARYPASRALTTAFYSGHAIHPDRRAPAAEPPPDPRREGVLHRAVREQTRAAVRGALIPPPGSAFVTDRRGRTALHLAADARQPTFAFYFPAARAAVNAKDRDGFTPVDSAEYWATRSARRAP